MIGTILNGAAIVVGGVAGLATRRQLNAHTQSVVKVGLGVAVVFIGFRLVWNSVGGSYSHVLKQLGIALLAMSLGNFIGRLMRLQKRSNRLGEFARLKLEQSGKASGLSRSDAFVVATVLFCGSPIGVLGAIQDGVNGQYQLLAVKGIMDGLATLVFVRMLGWSVICSAIPVVALFGFLTLFGRWLMQTPPIMDAAVFDVVNVTLGFMIVSVSLVILELKKVALADYLPCLVVAALLAKWWM